MFDSPQDFYFSKNLSFRFVNFFNYYSFAKSWHLTFYYLEIHINGQILRINMKIYAFEFHRVLILHINLLRKHH